MGLEKYLVGNFSLGDVIVRFNEHYLIGYQIIFILNAIFFKLNMLYEPILFVLVSYVTALIIFYNWRECLKRKNFTQSALIILIFNICCFGLSAAPGA
jgi:hypothetical protein